MVRFFELSSIHSIHHVLPLGCLAAFERFVFGSRHDFFMADFLPFFQSHLSSIKSIFFYCKDGGELLFYFSLAVLGLERQIEEI